MIRLTVLYPSTEGATADIMADIPNYASIAPVLQTSEIVD
jgi:hypothetical protein